MSEKNLNFDILIIGGSFAGMTAALALAGISDDLKIAIIEKQNILEQDKKRDGRAYAISSSSLQLFKEIGIFADTNKHAGKISDIKITDYKSPFFLDFIGTKTDEANGEFGQIIESFYIHNALRDQILKRQNIKIFCPNSYAEIDFVEDTKVKLDDGKILSGKLLLACDGRFSKLREHFQIHTTTKKYQQTAIVFNITHEKSHENIAHEKFLPGGPLAILPFQNPHQSSIVWIAKDKDADAILSLDEENFLHQLDKKMENVLGKVSLNSEKFSYPLTMIEAEKFYHKKMLLIGDAACGVHPIAGQGFNLAIAGIKILRNLLQNNLFSGLDIASQNLIDSYNKKARFEAKKMLVATDILNSLFETKNLSIGLARDFGLGLVNKISPLKKFFIKSAGGF
jgi:2-octaprenyl-6-methoxyphenol hydroxylase